MLVNAAILMKNYLAFICFLSITTSLTSQSTDIQYNYDFKINNDYENYDNTIIDITDWMIATPITEQTDKRSQYQTFLMNWAAGHPKVKVILNEWTNVSEIGDKNPVLLIIFIAAWARESIQSGNYDKLTPLHISSIKAVSEFYSANRDNLRKDRCVEKFIKLERKGKLNEWIRKRIDE